MAWRRSIKLGRINNNEGSKEAAQTDRETDSAPKKERKKTDKPREVEGWEDGTPPPHREFKERCVMR